MPSVMVMLEDDVDRDVNIVLLGISMQGLSKNAV